MSELEKIKRYVAKTRVNSDRYEMRLTESVEIFHMAEESPIEAIWLAFDYGRAKGYRMGKKAGANG